MDYLVIGSCTLIGLLIVVLLYLFGDTVNGKMLEVTSELGEVVGGPDKLTAITEIAKLAVASVKQQGDLLTNDQRKAMAMEIAKDLLKVAGKEEVDEKILGNIIEAQLFVLKLFVKEKEVGK